jgi:hypothetical protein
LVLPIAEAFDETFASLFVVGAHDFFRWFNHLFRGGWIGGGRGIVRDVFPTGHDGNLRRKP